MAADVECSGYVPGESLEWYEVQAGWVEKRGLGEVDSEVSGREVGAGCGYLQFVVAGGKVEREFSVFAEWNLFWIDGYLAGGKRSTLGGKEMFYSFFLR